MKKVLTYAFAIALASFTLASCGGDKKSDENGNKADSAAVDTTKSAKDNADNKHCGHCGESGTCEGGHAGCPGHGNDSLQTYEVNVEGAEVVTNPNGTQNVITLDNITPETGN